MLRALAVEFDKLRRASLPMWSAAVVLVAPSLSNVFARGMDAQLSWTDFFRLGSMTMGTWYGILLFGLITTFVFGREYVDAVAPSMLTSSIRREQFVFAKLLVIAIWVLALALLSIVSQAVWSTALGLEGFERSVVWAQIGDTAQVAALIYLTLPAVALLAVVSRGTFAPMIWSAFGFAAGMIGGLVGWGDWLPWAMPTAIGGTFLGPVASPYVAELTPLSWAIDGAVFVAGVLALLWWVNHADVRT